MTQQAYFGPKVILNYIDKIDKALLEEDYEVISKLERELCFDFIASLENYRVDNIKMCATMIMTQLRRNIKRY